MKRYYVALLGMLAVPTYFVLAQTSETTVNTILTEVQKILNQTVPILMVLATIIFLWGIIQYITAGGDTEKLQSARRFMVTGLIGLFLMVAVWGIVAAVVNTFDVGGTPIPGGPGAIGKPSDSTN
jgi:Na+/H+-dicarboxylate symporter